MRGLRNQVFWFPDTLASRWHNIPARLGYAVDPIPRDQAQRYWQAQRDGLARRIRYGYVEGGHLDSAPIEKLATLDRSATIVTGGTVINVTLNQDLLGIYDSTCSWWADVSVCVGSRFYGYDAYGSHVKFCQQHSDFVMATMAFAFLSSGAELAFPKGIDKELEWERVPGNAGVHLLTCSQDLATEWPRKILLPTLNYHLVPLCLTPHPRRERYVCGIIQHFLGCTRIYSGPAIDSSSGEDAAFVAIKSTGWLPRRQLADQLVQKSTSYGAIEKTRR